MQARIRTNRTPCNIVGSSRKVLKRNGVLVFDRSCYLLEILVSGNADSLQFNLANLLVSRLSSYDHISSAVFQTNRDVARVSFAPKLKVYTINVVVVDQRDLDPSAVVQLTLV